MAPQMLALGGQFCSNSQVPVKIHGHSNLKESYFRGEAMTTEAI